MTYDQRNLANTVHARGWRGTGRLDWCRGWVGNAARVELGFRPTGHSWQRGEPSNPDDRCMCCGRTRRQLAVPKPITLHQALKGN